MTGHFHLARGIADLPAGQERPSHVIHPKLLSNTENNNGRPPYFQFPTTSSRLPIVSIIMEPAQHTTRPDWDTHKSEIMHLYIDRNKTLVEVMREMEEKHGFHAR